MSTMLIKVPYLQVFEQHHQTAARYYPLGVGYISAYMKSQGHDVSLYDPEIQGLSDEVMLDRIANEKPKLIGLSSATPSFSRAMRMATAIRRVSDAVIVYGGVHASTFPEKVLEHNPQLDVTVVGEGEVTMTELATLVERGSHTSRTLSGASGELGAVRGLCFRDGATVRKTLPRPLFDDVDALPFPDRESLDMDLYRATGHIGVSSRVANLISSRGCPARCTFCESFLTMGYRFREHSTEYVMREVRLLKERYGVEQLVFNDDTFTMNRDRAKAICRALIRERLDLQWFCFARVNCGRDTELMELMREAGCIHINLGVETGDPDVLKSIKKGTTLNLARTTFKKCRELGIKTSAGFIFGFPTDTPDTMERTIEFAIELDPDVAFFNVLVPFPGTEVWKDFPALHGREHDPTFWDGFKTASAGGLPIIELPNVSREELKRMVIRANRRFYLRPRFLWRQLTRIRSGYELKANAIGAYELVSRNLRNLLLEV